MTKTFWESARKASLLATVGAAGVFGLAQAVQAQSAEKPLPCPPGTIAINVTLTNLAALTANNGDFTAAEAVTPFAGVNDGGSDKHFMGVFAWKPEHSCCQMSSGRLTVNMKSNQAGTSPTSSDAGNDSITVMALGVSAFGKAVYYPRTNPQSFLAGTSATLAWPLNNAALANININKRLSFYVQDDTQVLAQGTTLQLSGCCIK